MFLKNLEALWVAITFAEAGEYDYARTEIMKTDGQEFECPVIQPVSETL
jgi:hypothetical protein